MYGGIFNNHYIGNALLTVLGLSMPDEELCNQLSTTPIA